MSYGVLSLRVLSGSCVPSMGTIIQSFLSDLYELFVINYSMRLILVLSEKSEKLTAMFLVRVFH